MRILENLKSILLTLILTGSLWFDNYHGLSSVMSNMISFFYVKIDLEDANYIKEYLKPYKTTITSGDSGKWVYYVSSEASNNSFEYIKNLLINLTEFSVDIAYDNEWEELINRKSIICEFADRIDAKVLNLALNNKLDFEETKPLYISSIAITKTTTGGYIYLKSDDIIYRITVNDIGEFEQILSQYSNTTTYAKYVKLDEMGTTIFNGREIVPEYDVLLPLSAKSDKRHIVSKIVTDNLIDDIENVEEKVERIFNSYDYIKFITNENGYIYINDDESVIKLVDNIIEYIAESSENLEDKTTWISSFNTALRFIDTVSVIENLYLVSAKNIDGAYEFVLGTYLEEIPIIDSANTIYDSDKAKIYIKVDNNKVINYKEKLKLYSADTTSVYLSKFAHNILDNLLSEIPKKSEIKINDIELVYDISTKSDMPVWITEYEYNGNVDTVITEAAVERNY